MFHAISFDNDMNDSQMMQVFNNDLKMYKGHQIILYL